MLPDDTLCWLIGVRILIARVLQICLELTRAEVEEVVAEMFYLQALQSEHVVNFIGFVVRPSV